MSFGSQGTQSASATSMNFHGFEEMKGQGAPEILFNQIFIEPNLPETAGRGAHAAAGYIPGQVSYIKARRAIWSKSTLGRDLELQGYRLAR